MNTFQRLLSDTMIDGLQDLAETAYSDLLCAVIETPENEALHDADSKVGELARGNNKLVLAISNYIDAKEAQSANWNRAWFMAGIMLAHDLPGALLKVAENKDRQRPAPKTSLAKKKR